jgi:hypothetical protein
LEGLPKEQLENRKKGHYAALIAALITVYAISRSRNARTPKDIATSKKQNTNFCLFSPWK